jgi:hypothetical protein
MQRAIIVLLSTLVLGGGAGAAAALAVSIPIGPLPDGPTSTIEVQHGELVALALPHRDSGRVWRVARRYDAKVVHQVSEADVASSVVLVFRTGSPGLTTVSLALTKGDASAKALEARRFQIRVR